MCIQHFCGTVFAFHPKKLTYRNLCKDSILEKHHLLFSPAFRCQHFCCQQRANRFQNKVLRLGGTFLGESGGNRHLKQSSQRAEAQDIEDRVVRMGFCLEESFEATKPLFFFRNHSRVKWNFFFGNVSFSHGNSLKIDLGGSEFSSLFGTCFRMKVLTMQPCHFLLFVVCHVTLENDQGLLRSSSVECIPWLYPSPLLPV